MLDIGCGSGVPVARELVERGFAVTRLDGSATMLDLFRRSLPGSPAVLSDMRRLALERRFAGLVAWDSFFHLPPDDQRACAAGPELQPNCLARATRRVDASLPATLHPAEPSGR
ncbi:class I SAM-dependent methyltransferase [Sphingomonas sp.]|uniref:class I SAM-dependent methyltransferase n=1 Tax=Sphingomonas sp. TaxID=28214 RepID=UPI003AFFD225